MPADPSHRIRVTRYRGSNRRTRHDIVAAEEPLEVRVNDVPVAVIMRTPGDDFALAAGFLLTEGLLHSSADVGIIAYCSNTRDAGLRNVVSVRPTRKLDLGRLKRNTFASTSCGICGKASIDAVKVRTAPVVPVRPSRKVLTTLPDTLRAAQPVFAQTGGLHAAGIFDLEGSLMISKEDVGRHNAVDKAVGTAFLKDIALDRTILLVSGRASFEIVQKAAVARIPVVCAISAPSSLALDCARELKVTLVGLLRGRTMNVYTGGVST